MATVLGIEAVGYVHGDNLLATSAFGADAFTAEKICSRHNQRATTCTFYHGHKLQLVFLAERRNQGILVGGELGRQSWPTAFLQGVFETTERCFLPEHGRPPET